MDKRKIYIIIVITLLSLNVFGQIPNWAWANCSTGTANTTTDGQCIVTNSIGNIFVGGTFFCSTPNDSITFGTHSIKSNNGNWDIFINKNDSNGNVLWAKSFGGTQSDNATSITSSINNDILMTGNFYSDTLIIGNDTLIKPGASGLGCNAFVTRIDQNGNPMWAKKISHPGSDVFGSCVHAASGLFYLSGWTSSIDSIMVGSLSYYIGNGGGFIVKMDFNGTVQWVKGIGGNTWIMALKKYTGFCYGTGVSTNGVSIDALSLPHPGVYVTKLDLNGNAVWLKGPTNGGGIGKAIDYTTTGIYVTGNFVEDSISFGSHTLYNSSPGTNTYDIFILKYDENGNVLWAKSVGGNGNENAYSIAASASGVFVTGGFTSDSIGFDSEIFPFPVGGFDPLFIAKYDLNGNVICATTLLGGGNDSLPPNEVLLIDNGGAVALDNYGNAYIRGDFENSTMQIGQTIFSVSGVESEFLAKYNCSILTMVSDVEKIDEINISPNPFTSLSTITFTEEQKNTSLTVTDVLGNRFLQSTINSKQSTIDMSGYAKGMYFVEVRTEQGTVNKKIIKE